MQYKNKMGLISSIDIKKSKYKIMYWVIFAFLILVAFVCPFSADMGYALRGKGR